VWDSPYEAGVWCEGWRT